ncbi:hypothetical protein ACOSP7_010033 [Xanthoceras sorbifolium]
MPQLLHCRRMPLRYFIAEVRKQRRTTKLLHRSFFIAPQFIGITNVEEIHKLEFVNWFNQRIIQLYNEGQVDKKMVSLARGPERRAIYYSSYNFNGFRFHTIFRDEIRKTQNNGVVVRGENQTDVPYYGRIKDIVELCYTEGNKIVLFDCE